MPMTKLFAKPPKTADVEMEHFRIRLIARVCVIFIFITQVGQRLSTMFGEVTEMNPESVVVYIITVPFCLVLSLIVLVEFLLYKKLGPGVLKYSKIIDTTFFIVFTGEWMATLYGVLSRIRHVDGVCFSISSVFGLTSFSWRTLLQNFVVQRWQFKIIAPTCAFGLLMGYLVYIDHEGAVFTLVKGILQILYIAFIFYFEDKVNLKMLLTNLQQEKWVKINEFILENIPEKIAILSLKGELTYMSDYFKNYIKKCGFSLNDNQFFQEVTNLQQISDEANISLMDKTGTEKISFTNLSMDQNFERIASLDDLLTIFRNAISKGSIEEKAFLIFNGKIVQESTNEERSLEVKLSFIRQQTKPYIIMIVRDTTQRDHVLTLESNNKYKDQLLAAVSHELRTPLNGNINFVEAAIKAKDVPEEVRQNLLVPALKSSQLLLHLINDILDLSQISAQKLRLIFENRNIRETMHNAVQLLELHAKKKGLTLELEVDHEVPVTFCTDHTRLGQIILNLINNSVKFTNEGGVKISVNLLETNNRCLKICVNDTGIGMVQEDINKLFKEFTHIEFKDRQTVNPAGVGLGLSIANNLAKLLGPYKNKSITVTSLLGEGSEFSFVIEDKERDIHPLKLTTNFSVEDNLSDGEYAEIEPALEPRISKCLSSRIVKSLGDRYSSIMMLPCDCPRILVIDDDPFNILAFESVFDSIGVKCDSACSGKIAIDKLLHRAKNPCKKGCKQYSVVFVDKEMPGMDGVETVKKIQAIQKQNLVPELTIIGCTAHAGQEEVQRFLKSGINDCIQKPISSDVIKKILDKNLAE